MKNPVLLSTPEEVDQFVFVSWRSDQFREAHRRTGSLVNHYVKLFQKMPRIFYTLSDQIETAHFSTYWNAIPMRKANLENTGVWYENGHIHDLYLMHEIVHAVLLDTEYHPGISFEDWYYKMTENEFKASLITEVLIYFDMPDLRPRTFSHSIWVDRFLAGNRTQSLMRLWQNNPDGCYHTMYQERMQSMRNPDPFDWLELQMANYIKSNQEYANIWRKDFREVESAMQKFTNEVVSGIERKKCLENLLAWIGSVSTNEIPFLGLAQQFHDNYMKTKQEYGNQFLKSVTPPT